MKEQMISVIIPAYNSEMFIGKCIDSVLAQTYSNWELIAIDDGSRDNTFGILKSMPKQILVSVLYIRRIKGQALLAIQA